MSPLLSSKQQHTHPCHHCWAAPTQHTPMSPLLLSNQHAHTHVSVAGQHPPSTPMSPLLLSTHHNEHALAGLKIPRVISAPKSKNWFPYKRDMPARVSLYYLIGNQEPGRRRKKNRICPGRGPDVNAQGCHTPFRSPLTLTYTHPNR